jgi:thiosulfate reductase cytochrome b subunit
MSGRIYIYPLAIRIWHAINAISIIVLILSGVSLQYSNPDYPLIPFEHAIPIHNYCGIVLIASYILFIISNIVSKNGKQYRLSMIGGIKNLLKQATFYSIGIFKGQKAPFPISKENKFNPLQRLAYTAIMFFFVPILILTGIGLLYPELLPAKIFGLSSILITDLIHIASGFFVSIFLLIHLYFITIGKKPLKNFKSIVTGYHEDNH